MAYELIIIQAISRGKQTFVTRASLQQQKTRYIFEGKHVTFTSDNISIIASAINVSSEFIQWEIVNEFTDVPFKRGDIVTMYDTKEYLWALTPEKIKKRYLTDNEYHPRRSLEAQFSFTKGLSESVTGTDPQSANRGGLQVEGTFRNEFNRRFSMAYGFRYSRDIINLPQASFINTRFLGLIEGRYYFEPMEGFYHAQVGLGLGFGLGQSRTQSEGQVSFGNALLLPSTKISINMPVDKVYDIEFSAAFESLRLDESNANEVEQTTNLINSKFGVMIRKHL